MRIFLYLTLPLYALDQMTKQLVLRFIDPSEPRIVVPNFFELVRVTNTGAAFGSFRNNNSFFHRALLHRAHRRHRAAHAQ